MVVGLGAWACRPGAYQCDKQQDCAADHACLKGTCQRTCKTSLDCPGATTCDGTGFCVLPDAGRLPPTDAGAPQDAGGAMDAAAGDANIPPGDGGAQRDASTGEDASTTVDAAEPADAALGLDAAPPGDAAALLDAALPPDAAAAADASTPDDAGTDVLDAAGPVDAGGLPDCARVVRIDYNGADVAGAVVVVTVPLFSTLNTNGSNLRFFQLDGTPLAFWLQGSGGGQVVAQVRLALLPFGGVDVVANACGQSTDANGSDGVATFDHYATLDPTDRQAWSGRCDNFNASIDEICEFGVATPVNPPPRMYFNLKSSCMATSVNGVSSTYGRTLNLPAGSWVAQDERQFTGEHFAYCPGATTVRFSLLLGTQEARDPCNLNNCNSCNNNWATRTTNPFVHGGGMVNLMLQATGGDCAANNAESRHIRVKRHLNPAPMVTVLPP